MIKTRLTNAFDWFASRCGQLSAAGAAAFVYLVQALPDSSLILSALGFAPPGYVRTMLIIAALLIPVIAKKALEKDLSDGS